jgi:hypothetical protein
MFLPVLLVRDFGPLSFAVFAVPNVLGAVLMGAVLQRPGASEALVRNHGPACWTFSFVTLAFQVFFLCWMILGLEGSVSRWALAPMLLVIVLTGRADRASAWTRLVSMAVMCTSLVAGALWLSKTAAIAHIDPPRLPPRDLLWLAPVCVLGFGLSPYLDLTFHAARQGAPGRAGTMAFAIGFGILFLSMIMLTLLYTGPLLQSAQRIGRAVQPGLAPAPILLHMSVQLAFTIMLHKSWVEADPSPAGPKTPANASLLALVLGVAAAIGGLRFPGIAGLTGPEVIYRGFMAFYGLVFPAYVWICMLPLAANRPPTRRSLLMLTAAIALAAPMYWMGFIERQTWWLAPGVLVVLVGGLLSREPIEAAS